MLERAQQLLVPAADLISLAEDMQFDSKLLEKMRPKLKRCQSCASVLLPLLLQLVQITLRSDSQACNFVFNTCLRAHNFCAVSSS